MLVAAPTPPPPPHRGTKFIQLLAKQLSHDPFWTSSSSPALLDSSRLQKLLQQSVNDLPPGKLRSTLEQDPPRFVAALREEIQVIRQNGDLGRAVNGDLPRLIEGSLFADKDYGRLVEVLVDAVKSGAGAGDQGSEWCFGARQLLQARREPPLQLLWAYAALEIQSSSTVEVVTLPSSARTLLHCLKTAVLGNASAASAVAAVAPVVATVFIAVEEATRSLGFSKDAAAFEGVISEELSSQDPGTVSKSSNSSLRTLQDIARELLSFVVVCRNEAKRGLDCPLGLPLAPTHCQSMSSAFRCFSLLLEVLKVNRLSNDVEAQMLKVMFPLASKAKLKSMTRYEVNVGDISDIVTTEVVLLRLILECTERKNMLKRQNKNFGIFSQDALGRMRELAVHGVAAAGGHDFSGADVILDILLSPRLPVGVVLDSDDEIMLRGILYEAVLIEQPSFGQINWWPSSKGPAKISATFLKKLAVARKAVHHYRSYSERNRAITLLETVSTFSVPHQFLQWLANVKLKQERPETILQNARLLIGWLIDLDDVGFNAIYSKLASVDASKCKRELQEATIDSQECILVNEAQNDSISPGLVSQNEPDEDIFFVDTKGEKGEDKRSEAADKAFTVAAEKLSLSESTARKRRKQTVLFQRHSQLADSKRFTKSVTDWDSDFSLSDASEESQKAKKKQKNKRNEETCVTERGSDLSFSDDKLSSEDSTERRTRRQGVKDVESGGEIIDLKFRENSEARDFERDTDVTDSASSQDT